MTTVEWIAQTTVEVIRDLFCPVAPPELGTKADYALAADN